MTSKKSSKSKAIEKIEILQAIASAEASLSPGHDLIHQIKKSQLHRDADIVAALSKHSYTSFRELAVEAQLLGKIDDDLQKRMSAVSANFQSPADELMNTLYALEIARRQQLGLPEWETAPFIIELRNRDSDLYESEYDLIAGIDYFLAYFGIVINKLVKQRRAGDSPHPFDLDKVAKAGEHFALAADWQRFHEMRSFWEQGCASISGRTINSKLSEQATAFRISLSRLRVFRSSCQSDLKESNRVKKDTTTLPLAGFRSQQEFVSSYLISLQFYSKDLNEQVYGATLSEWLRAYTIVKEIAQETIASRPEPRSPNDVFWIAEPADVAGLLVARGGISPDAAKSIVKHFTFGQYSRDLLDAPFVTFGGALHLLPSVAVFIEPAYSLESLLKSFTDSTTHELAFIGDGFETSIKASLAVAGIHGHKIERKNGDEKYDCDVAFVLDDVLFLCECKGKFIPSEFQSYAKLEQYLTNEAVTQHTRTCDFFASNLQHVRHELGLPGTWTPIDIRRIIITSAKLGRPLANGGITIMDENTFYGFFARKHAAIRVSGVPVHEFLDERLNGKPTAKAFMQFASAPPAIDLHHEYLAEREIKLALAGGEVTMLDMECYGEILYAEDN
jgi:hypothetical protein